MATDAIGQFNTQLVNPAVVAGATSSLPAIQPGTLPGPAVVGLPYQAQITASDVNGDPVAFQLNNAPAGMTINPASGLITWLPTASQVGTYTVAVQASDVGGLNTVDYTLTAVAPDANAQPTITSTPPGPATNLDTWQYFVAASDSDGDPLSYSLVSGPAGMAFNSSLPNLLAWTPNLATTALPATIEAVIEVSDGRGGTASQTIDLEVLPNVSDAQPQVTSTAPNPATVNDLYQYQILAADPAGSPLTYTLTSPTNVAGMSVDANTGLFQWTPQAATSDQPVTVTISDQLGNSLAYTFDVQVLAAGSADQGTITLDTQSLGRGILNTPYQLQLAAHDSDGDPITGYALAGTLPTALAGLSLSPTGLITWTPIATGSSSLAFTVSDDRGTSATFTLPIEADRGVTGDIPTISSTPPVTAQIGLNYKYLVKAADADGDRLTYSLDIAPAGMTIDANTGLVTWQPAGDLHPGDPLLSRDGTPLRVASVAETGLVEQVYNLFVESHHTYFASDGDDGFSLLAHNESPEALSGQQPGTFWQNDYIAGGEVIPGDYVHDKGWRSIYYVNAGFLWNSEKQNIGFLDIKAGTVTRGKYTVPLCAIQEEVSRPNTTDDWDAFFAERTNQSRYPFSRPTTFGNLDDHLVGENLPNGLVAVSFVNAGWLWNEPPQFVGYLNPSEGTIVRTHRTAEPFLERYDVGVGLVENEIAKCGAPNWDRLFVQSQRAIDAPNTIQLRTGNYQEQAGVWIPPMQRMAKDAVYFNASAPLMATSKAGLLADSANLALTGVETIEELNTLRAIKLRRVFDELIELRSSVNLPTTYVGNRSVDKVATLLEIGSSRFKGFNGWIKATGQRLADVRSELADLGVSGLNAQTPTHAEGNVFYQALKEGSRNSTATLYVDASFCPSCGYPYFGLRPYLNALGIENLTVYMRLSSGQIVKGSYLIK